MFQALVRPERLVELIRTDCGYDLEGNSEFSAMRELMAHRHLFAHRSGLVDQQYLDDLRLVTGKA
ncbi:MAG: hypothetical protein ACJ71T_01415 [Actinomycetales bacterium]